jgi:hypothetical protein
MAAYKGLGGKPNLIYLEQVVAPIKTNKMHKIMS